MFMHFYPSGYMRRTKTLFVDFDGCAYVGTSEKTYGTSEKSYAFLDTLVFLT